jgi:hypothetical protein
MVDVPHDVTDLRLAPVALALNARIDELGRLGLYELAQLVALEGDRPGWTRAMRETGLLLAVGHVIDMHGWRLQLDDRGIRLSHGRHSLVLGIPDNFRAYLAGAADEQFARAVGEMISPSRP